MTGSLAVTGASAVAGASAVTGVPRAQPLRFWHSILLRNARTLLCLLQATPAGHGLCSPWPSAAAGCKHARTFTQASAHTYTHIHTQRRTPTEACMRVLRWRAGPRLP